MLPPTPSCSNRRMSFFSRPCLLRQPAAVPYVKQVGGGRPVRFNIRLKSLAARRSARPTASPRGAAAAAVLAAPVLTSSPAIWTDRWREGTKEEEEEEVGGGCGCGLCDDTKQTKLLLPVPLPLPLSLSPLVLVPSSIIRQIRPFLPSPSPSLCPHGASPSDERRRKERRRANGRTNEPLPFWENEGR